MSIFIIFFVPFLANADLGPKPTASFLVSYQGAPVEGKFYASMLAAYDCSKDCQERIKLLKGTTEEEKFTNLHSSLLEDKASGNKSELISPLGEILSYGDEIDQSLWYTLYVDEVRNKVWITDTFAWGGSCLNGECSFTYGLPDEFRLAVYLPGLDKKIISEPLERTKFNSRFEINLSDKEVVKVSNGTTSDEKGLDGEREESKEIKGAINKSDAVKSFFLTISLELIFMVLYIRFKDKVNGKKLVQAVLLGNFISLPIVWFVFPMLGISPSVFTLLVEVFAVFSEAIVLYLFMRNIYSFQKCLLISFFLNMISFSLYFWL